MFNKSELSSLIDRQLGLRVRLLGYQYREIIRNLANIFISGGYCIEDIKTHLKEYLESTPDNSAPSPDTILRGIKELSVENTPFVSSSGKSYDFNINRS